jgi:hypothetical protein
MARYEYDDTEVIVDKQYLGRIAAARFEAESWLQLHSADYFATPQNGAAMTKHMEENGIPLTAEGFEQAYSQLKRSGGLLPAREAVANMSASELNEFARQNGIARYDGFGRLAGYDLPAAYSAPTSSEGYAQDRQSSTLTPVTDAFPEDAGKTFNARQLASFSASRYEAYMRRTGQWGK